MFGRKGQSALEYLMTYGWAILIIIIVGGVLYYYGVFSPSKLVGDSKVGFSKIQVDTWAVDVPNQDLELILENRAGKQVNITSIKVGAATAYAFTPHKEMSAGARDTTFTTVDTIPTVSVGDAYKWDIIITYYLPEVDPGLTTPLTSTGTLSGTA